MTNRIRITGNNALALSSPDREEVYESPTALELFAATKAHHSRRGRQGQGALSQGGTQEESLRDGLLSEKELVAIETKYEGGITAVQIVEIFTSREVRFSEATFRKYVQQGLLPRSRRVGRKGKHRGSLGVYPPKVVRRINVIKILMAEGYTIEQIQEQFLQFTDVIERLEESVREAFSLFQNDAKSTRFDAKTKKSLNTEIVKAEKSADELLIRVNALSKRLSESHEDRYRNTSAAGSAEDLL